MGTDRRHAPSYTVRTRPAPRLVSLARKWQTESTRAGWEGIMRLFRRTSRHAATAPVAPEFGVRVTLRKGDKIVRRDARGAIHVTRITEERVDLRDVRSARPGR
jgi:hypothetical protein